MKVLATKYWSIWPGIPPSGKGESSFLTGMVWKYMVAALFVSLALWISHVLAPSMDGGEVFIFFVLASLVAGWLEGLGPGLAALVGGLLAADFFLIEPRYQLGPNSASEVVLMLTHACAAVIGLVAIVSLHRVRVRERELRVMTGRLAHEVAEHRRALEELESARKLLSQHARNLEDRVAERTAKLAETVKSLEGVLYHVAHDLRAPLRALSGFTELLIESTGPNLEADGKGYADRIIAAAARMDRLILDLLAYGHLGHRNVTLASVDMTTLLQKVLAGLDEEIKARQAVIEIVSPLPVVDADPTFLSDAIAEVVSNALRFTADGEPPRIRIRAESRETSTRLWVEDNGIGIKPEYQERIFRVFERLHPTEGTDGTGIGLAIVAKAMERLGGSAGVESQPGKGSRFWLELPGERRL